MTWLALAGWVSADASVPADSPLGQLVAERPVSTATTLPRLPVLFGLALENDSDLQSQRYQVKATEEQVDMAWSQLKPQVSVSGGYTYQESDNYYTDNPDYDPANDFVDTDYEARYAGQTKDAFWQLSLSQPLFSVERWRGVDKAESQVEAAQLQLALGESELAMAVVEAYLDALLASRQTRTAGIQAGVAGTAASSGVTRLRAGRGRPPQCAGGPGPPGPDHLRPDTGRKPARGRPLANSSG